MLRDVQAAAIDRIVIGGDVIPGPMPRETIALLRSLSVPVDCIQGNREREVLVQKAVLRPRRDRGANSRIELSPGGRVRVEKRPAAADGGRDPGGIQQGRDQASAGSLMALRNPA